MCMSVFAWLAMANLLSTCVGLPTDLAIIVSIVLTKQLSVSLSLNRRKPILCYSQLEDEETFGGFHLW